MMWSAAMPNRSGAGYIPATAIALLCFWPLLKLSAGDESQSIAQWSDQLSSHRAEVRLEAALALGKAGPRAVGVIPKLVRALEDKDARVREASAEALAKIGPSSWEGTIAALADFLSRETNPQVRAAIAFALGALAGRGLAADDAMATRVCAVLSSALSDHESIVKQRVAWALGRLGPAKAQTALGDMVLTLADPDAGVRREAAAALGQFGSAAHSAISALVISFKQDRDLEVRKTAIRALVNVVNGNDTELARDLSPALKDDDPEMAYSVALVLANIGGAAARSAVPVLCRTLQSSDVALRRESALAMARIGVEAAEGVTELTRALNDVDPLVRRNAALALGRVGPKAGPSVPLLMNLFSAHDQPMEIRAAAGEALSRISPAVESAIPALLKLLKEETDSRLKQWAVLALGRLDDPEEKGVVSGLIALLADASPEARLVRYDAAVLLGVQLGSKAPDKVLDVLGAYLRDKEVRAYLGSNPEIRTGGLAASTDETTLKPIYQGDCRYQAAIALARIGRRANRPDIMNGLREAARSSDSRLSGTAAAAIRRLETGD
jgi:HEAT repeat protein